MRVGHYRDEYLGGNELRGHPSTRHQEVVCTAGITERGEWVRLYPINYRYRPSHQHFRKYQWIEVALSPHGQKGDRRKGSREPKLESIRILGEPISTAGRWAERRKLIDSMPHHTVNQLKELHDKDRTSLGIVRPKRVLDLEVKPVEGSWKPKWEEELRQLRLFEPPRKPLRKLPYAFQYVFECEDSRKPHRAMIEDWELGVLYLNEDIRLDSRKAAAESVRKKFLDELCRADKDTRFFMGTRFPYNIWLVLGVFYPPRDPSGQKLLF